MKNQNFRKICVICCLFFTLIFQSIIIQSNQVNAGSYDGNDLAIAILQDPSTLVSSSYQDNDPDGCDQACVRYQPLGTMRAINGGSFTLLSTGKAGATIVTTNQNNPGDERGTYFNGEHGNPRDFAVLTMNLKVPPYMHYLYYYIQFFTSEWPEYIGTKFNDKLTITVNSPPLKESKYIFEINSGFFVFNSSQIPGTGYDIFAQSGNPKLVDIVSTTPRTSGADASATEKIPIGHPVTPNATITITFKIEDVGDNMFDSTVYIDNLTFSGYAKTNIVGKKEAFDLNGGEYECNDTIEYRVTITNTGSANQKNNPGNEFEDYLPNNVTYIENSAYANNGTINYLPSLNLITWNGSIPALTSRVLTFKVKINGGLPNNAIISNQGKIHWDSNEGGYNNAIISTDDIYIDDGIDQDFDGETSDDDPTIITVHAFDNPTLVIEDFSNDATGNIAYQYYLSRKWFETTELQSYRSCFEVVSGYHYLTAKSFKTKIRQIDGPQYWKYYFSNLNAKVNWWEIYFTCGDTSEAYELILTFQDNNSQEIAKIRLKYVNAGYKPMDWLLELSFWNKSSSQWTRLNSDFYQGYLRNEWYKLRIQTSGINSIDYSLSRRYRGNIDFETALQLNASLIDLAKIKFNSTTNPNPAVCPLFFWDDHKIGLSY